MRLVLLRASLTAGDFEGTVAGRVLEAADMPPAAAPNCLLAVLWASLANTVSCKFVAELRSASCLLIPHWASLGVLVHWPCWSAQRWASALRDGW